jgi:hypothetical protein
MDIAGQHIRDPHRQAAGIEQGLDVPAEVLLLPRIPQVKVPAFPAHRFLVAAVAVHYLAVQDHVRRPLRHGPFQGLLQAGHLREQDLRALGYVAVRRRLRQPGPGPQPRDIRLIPVPGQDEQCLPVTAQAAGALPGADLPAAPGQQPRDIQDKLSGHVKSDTIGDQRGVSRQADFFVLPVTRFERVWSGERHLW